MIDWAIARRTSSSGSRQRPSGAARALRAAGLRPRKSLGQHFLTSKRYLRQIADAAELSSRDTVIEVGAGLGALTAELAQRAGRVVAIELDEALAAELQRRFLRTNVEIVSGNALDLAPAELLGTDEVYSVTGNLPYNVAQPLVRHFLEATPPPQCLVVMVQAEVAESVIAGAGSMSLLSISVQLYGEPRLLFRVPPSAFHPPPKVSSAIVRIEVSSALRAPVDDIDAFFRVVRAGFSSRRKQLRNALANGLRIQPPVASALLRDANIDATLRPQALALDAWAALTRTWIEQGRPEGRP